MKSKIFELAALVGTIKDIIMNTDGNVLWSHYDNKDQVINELHHHITMLEKGDISKLNEIIMLFSPTSDLQEISINNGWGDKFLEFAKKFDSIISEIETEMH
jgi:hypothetical protein